jgi:hypothetical protein
MDVRKGCKKKSRDGSANRNIYIIENPRIHRTGNIGVNANCGEPNGLQRVCFRKNKNARQMYHICKRVCKDAMILWFVEIQGSCQRKKRDIQRCLKQKGIESVISNIEEKKRKEKKQSCANKEKMRKQQTPNTKIIKSAKTSILNAS